MQDATALILQNTIIAAPPACPEIKLRLAPDLVAFWEVMEAALDSEQPPPFWAHAWVGGQALARYVLDTPETVAGRQVLDFGAGCGLVAIAAAMAGAEAVTACDIDPMACAVMPMNAGINSVHLDIVAESMLDCDLDAGVVVLAADIWYELLFADRMTGWLRRLSARGHTVLVGDRQRKFFPTSGLERLAGYELATSRDTESGLSASAGVWRVQP